MSIRGTPPSASVLLKDRGCDPAGCGHYGASRGARLHRGVDKLIDVGWFVHTHIPGKVTKLGYVYKNDLHFRYVQVMTTDGYQHRFMYVEPMCEVGDYIQEQGIIGTAQDIAGKWEGGMKNHIHYEVKKDEEYYDPEEWL